MKIDLEEKSVLTLAVMALLFIVVWIVLGPIFTIWSLNLVFGLEIPLTFWTWLSVVWLVLVIRSRNPSTNRKKDE